MRLNNVLFCNARSYTILLSPAIAVVQKQTAVTAYYESILLLLFAEM